MLKEDASQEQANEQQSTPATQDSAGDSVVVFNPSSYASWHAWNNWRIFSSRPAKDTTYPSDQTSHLYARQGQAQDFQWQNLQNLSAILGDSRPENAPDWRLEKPDTARQDISSRLFSLHQPQAGAHQQATLARLVENRPDQLAAASPTVVNTRSEAESAGWLQVNLPTNSWMFPVLLTSLLIVGLTRVFHDKLLKSAVVAGIDYRESQKDFQSQNAPMMRGGLLLTLVFVLNTGLFAYQGLDYAGIALPISNALASIGLLSLGVGALFLAKKALVKALGFLTLSQQTSAEYLHSTGIYNRLLGLVLFPVVVGIPYVQQVPAEYFLYAGLGLFGLAHLLRIGRGIKIFGKGQVSLPYMVLYFCAVEILPVLILIKLFLQP